VAGIARDAGRVLHPPHVCKVTGLKRLMIDQMDAEHRFHCWIKINVGARAVGWPEGEVWVGHMQIETSSSRPTWPRTFNLFTVWSVNSIKKCIACEAS